MSGFKHDVHEFFEDIRDLRKRASRRLGRRGAVLINLAIVWFFVGLGEIIITDTANPQVTGLFLRQVDVEVRITAWWVCAVLAFIAAWVPRGKADTFGWIALYIMPALRAASFLWGWIESLDGINGYPNGWLAAIIYMGFVSLIIICSGWKETPELEDEETES